MLVVSPTLYPIIDFCGKGNKKKKKNQTYFFIFIEFSHNDVYLGMLGAKYYWDYIFLFLHSFIFL